MCQNDHAWILDSDTNEVTNTELPKLKMISVNIINKFDE